jgi:transcriptional regulator with XRE-family HTH domain
MSRATQVRLRITGSPMSRGQGAGDHETALRKLRAARNLTRAELARRAGVSEGTIVRWERTPPPPIYARLLRLADVLACTLDELVGRVKPQAVLSELDARDRELLDAMQRDAETIIGPQVMRLASINWRSLARAMWLGHLFGLRNGTTEPGAKGRRVPLPTTDAFPQAPEGWYTGWESVRQKALAKGGTP